MIWTALAILCLLAVSPVLAEALRPRITARARHQAPGRFIQLSKGVTHYQWRGPSRGPVAVCVHGLTTPAYVWAPLAGRLTRLGMRVLSYDLYGRGLSDRPAGRQDRAFFVGQLEELLAGLELTQGVTLIGYSMGAAIAAAFAETHPERVDRLVLVAPAGLGNKLNGFLEFCAAVPLLGDGLIRLFGAVAYRRGIRRTLPDVPEVPDLIQRCAREMQFRGSLPALLSSARYMLREDMAPVHHKLAETGLPVLAIWGKADAAIPLAGIGRLAQINRNARQIEVEDATHTLPMSHPDAVMAALTEVLREPA